jgi:hypothetical protein
MDASFKNFFPAAKKRFQPQQNFPMVIQEKSLLISPLRASASPRLKKPQPKIGVRPTRQAATVAPRSSN